MSVYDPVTLRDVAKLATDSPMGLFPRTGLMAVAYPGLVDAAMRWATNEANFLFLAREIGIAGAEARTVLDGVVDLHRRLGLDASGDEVFRVARGELYARVIVLGPSPDLNPWRTSRLGSLPPSRVLNAKYRQRLRNRTKRKRR